jgi:hypothetical protein
MSAAVEEEQQPQSVTTVQNHNTLSDINCVYNSLSVTPYICQQQVHDSMAAMYGDGGDVLKEVVLDCTKEGVKGVTSALAFSVTAIMTAVPDTKVLYITDTPFHCRQFMDVVIKSVKPSHKAIYNEGMVLVWDARYDEDSRLQVIHTYDSDRHRGMTANLIIIDDINAFGSRLYAECIAPLMSLKTTKVVLVRREDSKIPTGDDDMFKKIVRIE